MINAEILHKKTQVNQIQCHVTIIILSSRNFSLGYRDNSAYANKFMRCTALKAKNHNFLLFCFLGQGLRCSLNSGFS